MNSDNLPIAIQKVLVKRRKHRINQALSRITIKPEMKVIDIGCGIDGRSFENYIPTNWEIIGIDLKDPKKIKHTYPNFTYIQQNAQDLSQFKDNQFDLAVSIGLLEHVIEEKAFRRTVSEIRRVAKQHIVTVPARVGWIEPHYGFPFFPLYYEA